MKYRYLVWARYFREDAQIVTAESPVDAAQQCYIAQHQLGNITVCVELLETKMTWAFSVGIVATCTDPDIPTSPA